MPAKDRSPTRHEWLVRLLGGVVAFWVWAAHRGNRWSRTGFEEVAEALAAGPVVIVLWHARLFMSAQHLSELRSFTILHDQAPAGRIAGACQRIYGMRAVTMGGRGPGAAANRAVIEGLRRGVPLALTADGPRGPAHICKAAPVDWARISGAPVFLYAAATTRQRRAKSWDSLLLPRLFGRGHAGFARWDRAVPKRASAEELEEIRQELEAALIAHQAGVDAKLGLPPGP
ncbi:MAG: DUF374 domain-containing protein [Pseudomonadota bacterium]